MTLITRLFKLWKVHLAESSYNLWSVSATRIDVVVVVGHMNDGLAQNQILKISRWIQLHTMQQRAFIFLNVRFTKLFCMMSEEIDLAFPQFMRQCSISIRHLGNSILKRHDDDVLYRVGSFSTLGSSKFLAKSSTNFSDISLKWAQNFPRNSFRFSLRKISLTGPRFRGIS